MVRGRDLTLFRKSRQHLKFRSPHLSIRYTKITPRLRHPRTGNDDLLRPLLRMRPTQILPFASLQPSEPAQSNQNSNLPLNTWHQELFRDIPPQPNINSNISKITWNQDQIQHDSFKELLIREMKHTQGWSLTVNTSIPRLIYTTFNDVKKIEKPKRRSWSI